MGYAFETYEAIIQNLVDLLRMGVLERSEGNMSELSPEDYVRSNGTLRMSTWGSTATNEEIDARAKEMGLEQRW